MDDLPEQGGRCGRKPLAVFLARCGFTVLFSLIASFFFSFLFGIVAILIGGLSSSRPVSVPAQCRIISSSVDLRSSKVCELGVSNYKSKHVFYPLKQTKVHCRDDYYWASVLKVEYNEYVSGRTLHAVAEAPKEALPLYCRPSFGTAWLTKSKFKVNETYKCRYTPGTYKADIYPDNLFNCQAEDPSMMEMIRRFFVLFPRSINSFSSDKGRGGRTILDVSAGVVGSMLCSMCLVITVKIIRTSRLALARKWEAGKLHVLVLAVYFRRACLLIALVSAMGCLTLQYSMVVGLKQLLFNSHFGEITR